MKNRNTRQAPELGLACKKCGSRNLRVRYTRPRYGHIFRSRECRVCGKRMFTRERFAGTEGD